MPQFVQQASTYGYDKASPYVDAACNKVPLLQKVAKQVVPYAKLSIELSDKIVDAALGLASKPVALVQGSVSSIGDKADAYKAVVATMVSDARSFALKKTSDFRASATTVLDNCKSSIVDKRSLILRKLQDLKASVISNLGQVRSSTSERLRAVANRLHLTELRDALPVRVVAGKNYVHEMRDTAGKKGSALKKRVIAISEAVSGRTYSVVAGVVGMERVDYVLEVVIKYSPLWKNCAKKTSSALEQKNK